MLNDEWAKEEIGKKVKKIMELNEDENTTKQNFWDTGKVVLREKFVSLSGYTTESGRT